MGSSIKMKKLIIIVLLILVSNNVFAETQVEGLLKEYVGLYDLRIEISDNDTNVHTINIYPVNVLQVTYNNFSLSSPEEMIKTKITPEQYENIYRSAVNAILNFKILEEPHKIADSVHLKLSLTVNGRTISIGYESIESMKGISKGSHEILTIVKGYLPEDKQLMIDF